MGNDYYWSQGFFWDDKNVLKNFVNGYTTLSTLKTLNRILQNSHIRINLNKFVKDNYKTINECQVQI